MEGAKEEGMPVEAEISPRVKEDPLGEAKFKNAVAATNPFAPSVSTAPNKQIDSTSFLGKWAKRILAPLGAKPPQEENKQETPTPTESLP